MKYLSVVISLIVMCSTYLTAMDVFGQPRPVRAELMSNAKSFSAGDTITVAVNFKIDPSWHLYWRDPGDSGLAIAIDWDLPDYCKLGPLQWPTPERFDQGGLVGFGYSDEVALTASLSLEENFDASLVTELQIAASVRWLACKEACIPGRADLRLLLPIAQREESEDAVHIESWLAQVPVSIDSERLHFQSADFLNSSKLVIQWGGDLASRLTEIFPYPVDNFMLNYAAMKTFSAKSELTLTVSGSPPEFWSIILVSGEGETRKGYLLRIPTSSFVDQ